MEKSIEQSNEIFSGSPQSIVSSNGTDFSPPMIQVDPSYGWEASPSQGIKGSDPTPPFTILQESDPNSFSQLHDINSNYSRSSIAPERSSPRLACSICGDKATGKHYGANSCDGCKGFFRRSVRKNHQYQCRFERNCTIDKDKRNQCRHCRLKKCLKAGMKKEAVQNERDRISVKKPTSDKTNSLSVGTLLNADIMSKQPSNKYANFVLMPRVADTSASSGRVASHNDVCSSMRHQLVQLVEWAKHIPVFSLLNIDDQVHLLRAHAGESLIMGVAKRSLPYKDFLLLGNDYVIPRRSPDFKINKVAVRVLDELVRPLKELDLDDKEYACVKAIIFFDPEVKSLVNPSKVKAMRAEVMCNLEDYINEKYFDSRGRFGEILLLLPTLRSITSQMIGKMHTGFAFEGLEVDILLQEMLLGLDEDSSQEVVSASSSSSPQFRSPQMSPPLNSPPQLTQPQISHLEMTPPHISHPDMTPPHISHPDMTPPHISHPEMTPPHISHPDMNPSHISHPDMTSPHIIHPEMTPSLMNHRELTPTHMNYPEMAPQIIHPQMSPPVMSSSPHAVNHTLVSTSCQPGNPMFDSNNKYRYTTNPNPVAAYLVPYQLVDQMTIQEKISQN